MKSVHLRTNVPHSKWYLPDRGNIGDIRLLSWGKFFTVQGGLKRPHILLKPDICHIFLNKVKFCVITVFRGNFF